MQNRFRLGRFVLRQIATPIRPGFRVCVALAVAATSTGCRDTQPLEPAAYAEDDIEIQPEAFAYQAQTVARFTVTNRTASQLALGACAVGLEYRAPWRWIQISGAVDCDAVLFIVPPQGSVMTSYPLAAHLPSGFYRARFSFRQANKASVAVPDEFSAPFRVRANLPAPDLTRPAGIPPF